MIVVADTTPLNYLILIEKISVLPSIFSFVVVPKAVIQEMSHPKAPLVVSEWANCPPDWVDVRDASLVPSLTRGGLGRGETSAISIALEFGIGQILMDDKKAVLEATDQGLKIITTFLVLEIAAAKGLLDLESAIASLAATNFRFPPDDLVKEMLNRNKRKY